MPSRRCGGESHGSTTVAAVSEEQSVVDNYTGPASCPRHADTTAIGNCSRCGTFVCGADSVTLFGKLYCQSCAARPEVNYLETLRLKYWGKRDGWAWFYGLGAFGYLGSASLYIFVQQDIAPAVCFLVASAVCACFWLGQAWARIGLLAVQFAFILVGAFSLRPELSVIGVFSLLTAVAPFTDLRNKLFFRLPVEQQALQKYWSRFVDNTAARNGLMLGMSSLLFPLFIPLALVFCVVGLSRVDPYAHPPVGKRKHAIAGLVFSVVAIGLWVVILTSVTLK